MVNIEKQTANNIAGVNGLKVAKLGLRFDKVVVRLLANLRSYVDSTIIDGKTIIMTITAPIKIPAKTERQLEAQIKDFLHSKNFKQDQMFSILKNEVRLRIVSPSSNHTETFIGFVHNPGADVKLLLDLTTKWLTAP